MQSTQLQTLNPEWGISIARTYKYLDGGRLGYVPVLFVHSPGLGYAFDSTNSGLDSPHAAMAMLSVLGLYELADPYGEAPPSDGWSVWLDRPHDWDDPRPSSLRGPYPIAPIGPISNGHVPDYWRRAVDAAGGECQLRFVSGVDLKALDDSEVPEQLATAAQQCRLAGATVRVYR